MARRYRHHRQNKAAAAVPSPQSQTTPKLEQPNEQTVPHDIKKTILVTGFLILLILLAAWWNGRTDWTASVGSQLYRLLHIR